MRGWRPLLVAVLWTKAASVMVTASILGIDILADWSILTGLAALAVTGDYLAARARATGSEVAELMALAARNGHDVSPINRR